MIHLYLSFFINELFLEKKNNVNLLYKTLSSIYDKHAVFKQFISTNIFYLIKEKKNNVCENFD